MPSRHLTSRSASKKSPVVRPSFVTSIRFAAGTRGNPGIVMISPQTTTKNSAPADSLTSRTGTTWCFGAPNLFGSVVKLYCVLAIHTGKCPKPLDSRSRKRSRTL